MAACPCRKSNGLPTEAEYCRAALDHVSLAIVLEAQKRRDVMSKTQKPSVEDRLDLMELFAKYCWALDTGDEEGVVSRFVPDGWMDHKPQGRFQGSAAIRKLVNEFWFRFPYNYPGRQHQQSGFVITREGDGARVRACWTVLHWHQLTQQCYTLVLGDWNAYCVKRDDEWKFQTLLITHWRRETAPWVGDPKARFEPGPELRGE
jgi:hypothetical protein